MQIIISPAKKMRVDNDDIGAARLPVFLTKSSSKAESNSLSRIVSSVMISPVVLQLMSLILLKIIFGLSLKKPLRKHKNERGPEVR